MTTNKVTIFGDIQGNLPALTAALADMDNRGLESRYCLGDLVGYGTSPNEIIALVRERGYPTIMGNYDERRWARQRRLWLRLQNGRGARAG